MQNIKSEQKLSEFENESGEPICMVNINFGGKWFGKVILPNV